MLHCWMLQNEEYAYPAYKFHLVSTSLILLKIDENCSRGFLKCSGQVYLVPPRSIGKGYGRTSVTTHPNSERKSDSITTPGKSLLWEFDIERTYKGHFE